MKIDFHLIFTTLKEKDVKKISLWTTNNKK